MALNLTRLNCLKLWRIWNFFLILFLYIYLTYDSIMRYISFKKSSMDLAFGSIYCPFIMNIYLMSIVSGLTSILLSFYCLLYANGNYSDDGIRLGKDTDNFNIFEENEHTENVEDEVLKSKKRKGYLLKRFKKNFLPFSCLLHYLSAILFLMPLPFVEAQQIRQRVLTANNIWHTDLDFLFNPDTWHKVFLFNKPSVTWLLRPQYFNLILSLISMSLRYPSVFWVCHRGFSFIFSFLMMLSSIHILLDYSTTSILVRIAYNPEFLTKSLRIIFISPISLITLSFVGSTVILVTFWCVFEFGFQQFLETLSNYRHMVIIQSDSSHDESNVMDSNCCKKKHLYMRGYLPHFAAICGGTIGMGMKIPLFYAGIDIIYKVTSDPMILTNLLISIIFICCWLITWFGFSLKPTWRFTLSNCSKIVSDISSTTTTIVQQQRKQSLDQSNQIYSCFHNLDNRLAMGDNTLQSRLRSRDYYPEETDMNNAACTNYVYLQSAMNPALNPMLIPQPLLSESPIMKSYVETIDQRNTVSDSESSYDSAINIRNQLMSTLDHQIGRSQSQSIRNFGVLKYSGSGVRSHTPEYIPLQNENNPGRKMMFENCSSPETSTLHAAESDTTLKSNPGSQQILLNTVSLNRQNSNKKRTFGQRVTFKDDKSADAVDCSPNNSEQSSNNTTSSDSGIDSHPKQHRYLQNHLINATFSDAEDNTQNLAVRTVGNVTNSNCAATNNNSTKFNFEVLTSNQELLNSRSQSCPIEDLLTYNNDEHSMSYISEDDQEQKLCSQV